MWLIVPVEETDERGQTQRTTRNKDMKRGSPQGAPISPLLSNLYMRRFILGWKVLGHEQRLGARILSPFRRCCYFEKLKIGALTQRRLWVTPLPIGKWSSARYYLDVPPRQ
jgi:hypothetical protein